MYLHVGNNKIIRICDIIGIFDTDSSTFSSVITRKMLSDAEKRGEVESAGTDIPKSFILYRYRPPVKENGGQTDKEGYRICFSELSSSALLQRMNNITES